MGRTRLPETDQATAGAAEGSRGTGAEGLASSRRACDTAVMESRAGSDDTHLAPSVLTLRSEDQGPAVPAIPGQGFTWRQPPSTPQASCPCHTGPRDLTLGKEEVCAAHGLPGSPGCPGPPVSGQHQGGRGPVCRAAGEPVTGAAGRGLSSASRGRLPLTAEATVFTWSHFLFTPQEARERLPPPPPQEDTAGRAPRTLACCPSPAAGPPTAPSSEAEPGRRGGSPGRLSARAS